MKKVMASIICALLFVGAMVSAAADVKDLNGKSVDELTSYLQGLDANGWAEAFQTALDEGTNSTMRNLITAAEGLLNSYAIEDKDLCNQIVATINDSVPEITICRSFDGKFVIFMSRLRDVAGGLVSRDTVIDPANKTVSSPAFSEQ